MSTSPTSSEHAAANPNPGVYDSDLRPGQNLGRYRILRLIAKGGMANVYLAQHIELEVIRAIKVLKPGFSEESRARLKTEAKISAHLHHPNIVQLYGLALEDQATPYLEMEYVDGWSLTEILQRAKPLPAPTALSIAIMVCRALDYAHRQRVTLYGQVYEGLVHRDIKPANIMIAKTGEVKLADFGIARPGGSTIHTVDSKVMGTFAYLSPEQLTETNLDQRSDIYSLGAVIYEMLSGSKLFPHSNLVEIVQSKSHGNYRDLRAANPGITPEICRIVDKGIMLDKTKRFSSAAEFSEALGRALHRIDPRQPEAILGDYIQNPRPAEVIKQNQRPQLNQGLLMAALVVGAVACMSAAIYLVNNWPPVATSRLPLSTKGEGVAFARKDSAVPAPKRVEIPGVPTEETAVVPAQGLVVPASPVTQPAVPPDRPAGSVLEAGLKAFDQQQYGAAIELLEKASREVASAGDADLLSVRLLGCYLQAGELAKARDWAATHSVKDGHYLLLQGITYYRLNEIGLAEEALLGALSTPSKYSEEVQKQASYYNARLRSAVYQGKPNTDNRARARTAWGNYLSGFCKSGDGDVGCVEARSALAEIGQ